MEEVTRQRVRFLVGFAIYFVALWLLWNTPIVYPLKIFVVLLHEISHGIVAVLTGGAIQKITISAGQGGVCECAGGSAFLTLSAGYLGSLLWGAAILRAARGRGRVPRIAVIVIGVLVIVIALLFVRNAFGLLFSVTFGAAMIMAGRLLPVEGDAALLTVLGLTSCLYAILDIKSDILDRPGAVSDAHLLAGLTGVPAVIWGVLWIAIALLVSGWLFRGALRRAGAARPAARKPV